MLQRIQTIYLLLAAGCMVLASVLPLATFTFNGEPVIFEALGFYQNGELLFSTWGLFALGAISAVLALVVVFLFRNRILQIRLTVVNIILMVGFYLLFLFFIFIRNPEAGTTFEKIGAGIIMPAISIILSYLAIRKIGEDEVLVRSLDRLRG
jgi:glucan phosphoethanolaminetransferase (alkaline phosphatase superfamily)